MTDKNIENWINRISESKNGYFLLTKQIDLEKDFDRQAEILSENFDIDYLEKELNLVIRLLSKNKNANIIKLSLKGIDVVNKGGWIKYKSKEQSKKRTNKNKKLLSYWTTIIIPFSMFLLALWEYKNDNQEIRNGILKEVKQLHNQQRESLQLDIQILTKKVDSLLLETSVRNSE